MKTNLPMIALLFLLLTSCIRPDDSTIRTADGITKATRQPMAYVSDRQLWLTTYDGASTLDRGQAVDACLPEPAFCRFAHLRWSPTGDYLLYQKQQDEQSALHLLDRHGKTRLVAEAGDPVWSMDGQSLLYLGVDGLRRVDAPFTDGGRVVGRLTNFGDSTCGGGGFPASEFSYGLEGLGTFPYNSLPGHMAWLVNDRLLYTRHCTGAGMGQFDLQSGTELPMLDDDRLQLFTTNRTRDHWAAITRDHHLAVGSAADGLIGTRPVAESIPTLDDPNSMNRPGVTLAGGVFYGPVSGRLYYTTRQLQQWVQLTEEQFSAVDMTVQNLFVSIPHFPIYQTTLFATTATDWQQAQVVWQGNAYGVGSVTEAANGDLLFVQIDNGQALYETLQANPTLADVQSAWPKPQIIRIPADGSAPQQLLDNAGQVALARLSIEQ